MSTRVDYCVVGGGIVGLATAMSVLDLHPGASLVLVEKEAALARHHTGHNSGVVHSGIYYAPGSAKARLCRAGERATKEFCREHAIPLEPTGKILVACTAQDDQRLAGLEARGAGRGITTHPLSSRELADLEPHVRGRRGLLVDETATVDYTAVCKAMAATIRSAGGEIRCGRAVTALQESSDEVAITAGDGDGGDEQVRARRVVVCAGLQADRLARLAGISSDVHIVPFRGEYFTLAPQHADVVRHHIYPVPDPALPFLGVHLTRGVGGGVSVGPNAVLGLARERYRKGAIDARDVADYLRFPGFWRFAGRHVGVGARELYNSMITRGYLRTVRRYVPELTLADLRPAPAGIRAQAMTRSGELVHDFVFAATDRTMHVLNAPSPAATSAIPIGREIAARLTRTGAV